MYYYPPGPNRALMFLGGTDLKEEGTFVWVSTGKTIDVLEGRWSPGEPNNNGPGEEDYVTMIHLFSGFNDNAPDTIPSFSMCQTGMIIIMSGKLYSYI